MKETGSKEEFLSLVNEMFSEKIPFNKLPVLAGLPPTPFQKTLSR